MFPGVRRLATKEMLMLRDAKPNEYWLYDTLLNDTDRVFKVFQLDTGDVFGISAMVEESLILKQVLKEPSRYKTTLHTINGLLSPLGRVYMLAKKFPKINELPVSNATISKVPAHGTVNYMIVVGKNNKLSMSRCAIYGVPMQLQAGFNPTTPF